MPGRCDTHKSEITTTKLCVNFTNSKTGTVEQWNGGTSRLSNYRLRASVKTVHTVREKLLALRSVGRLRHGCNVRIFGSFRNNRKFEEKQPASLLIIDVSCRVTALVSPSTALQADDNSN
ncbi:hypothetical protein J6590_095199 [Homalodisca vitripennis]|nr:hypothetical protein J6590_095199 [Homalodisca vitripennis]